MAKYQDSIESSSTESWPEGVNWLLIFTLNQP
jgi:hypothetical protein